MKTEIYLGKVNVSNVQSNSVLIYGESYLNGWKTRVKSNSALSGILGDSNMIASRLNFLNDPDACDTILTSKQTMKKDKWG